ncbi:hypothetical protein Tco_1064726, partial [Tanacetum coccineum]
INVGLPYPGRGQCDSGLSFGQLCLLSVYFWVNFEVTRPGLDVVSRYQFMLLLLMLFVYESALAIRKDEPSSAVLEDETSSTVPENEPSSAVLNHMVMGLGPTDGANLLVQNMLSDESTSVFPKDEPSSAIPEDELSSAVPDHVVVGQQAIFGLDLALNEASAVPKDEPSSAVLEDEPSSVVPEEESSSAVPEDEPSSAVPEDEPSSDDSDHVVVGSGPTDGANLLV